MSALFGGELPHKEYDGALFGGEITAEPTVSKTDCVYAIIFDPEGYHTLKALFQSENHAKQCARTLEEVSGCPYEVVPWEV